ncbi:MAG: GNAT family N-acetyltransferase [Alphaproteobacteria bacterium]|nr:GNAT family N-acetyltransferase [Alphaproteobacteria bacterium]
MSQRNLGALFHPASIALIGASERPGTVGAVLAQNLLKAGFGGPVFPVNPGRRSVDGVWAYPDVASLPATPDLAVIATPPATVPGLVAELGRRGTRAVVVITAGFGEGGDAAGKLLRQQVLDAARPHLVRIVGPNCVGVQLPAIRLDASFARGFSDSGDLAFVVQSGAVATSVLDWAKARAIGFSAVISLGDMIDVDFGDLLNHFATDTATRAILLYVEAVTSPRKFMSAARAAARIKPVVVVKAGRHAEGARAAASHTGALAGSDAVYDAAFRRAGVLRVLDLQELFAAVETLSRIKPFDGDRLAILSNGGGIGVLATDALIDHRAHLADLAPATLAGLDRVLPQTWSKANPVDIIGDATGRRYADALTVLLADPGIDAVLILNCPTAIASGLEAAEAVVGAAAAAGKGRVVLTSWLGDSAASEARKLFRRSGIPTFDTPEQAIRGFAHLVRYRESQRLLMEVPPSVPEFTVDTAMARRAIDGALAEGREWLDEVGAKTVLDAYGIPTVPTRIVGDAAAAAAAAAALARPVALKILSPDITHKSDVGGVILDLDGAEAVRHAAVSMAARVRAARPEARLRGFTVQPMERRTDALETIVGIAEDTLFGPVVLFGHGGTAVEAIDDKALALPPLNLRLAHELIHRTRIAKLLAGYRDKPPVDLDALALTLVRVAQLAADLAEVVELDINPLLVDVRGVIALDARIRVRRSAAPAEARLAIRPYPRELESEAEAAGQKIRIRPIRPEDEPALHAFFSKLSPEDVRMRFLQPLKRLPGVLAQRLTQIDYDREMALTAFDAAGEGLLGVCRLSADPDNARAEFAVIVRTDRQGIGLGHVLMTRILAYAWGRGIGRVFGDVLAENARMLELCRTLGAEVRSHPEDSTLLRVVFRHPRHRSGA